MFHHCIISAALLKYSFLSLFPDGFLAVVHLCCCTGSSPVAEGPGYSLAEGRGLLLVVASLVPAPRVEHKLSSYGVWVLLLCGMWDPPKSD